jgi:hypothetical protein
VAQPDGPFNRLLIEHLREPPFATENEAFHHLLGLMQMPDWIERVSAGEFSKRTPKMVE